MGKILDNHIALVAGATRGAGRAIAVELARAGAFVYATGRSSRKEGPSDINRPETIEETEELIRSVGGEGLAIRTDHLNPEEVRSLIQQIDDRHHRLDIVVNDIFGGDRYAQWDKRLWEHDLNGGLKMMRMGIDTHLITLHYALPLMLRGEKGIVIEMTDGTAEANTEFRQNVGFYYDLAKSNVARIVKGLTYELANAPVTALGVTPGWLRSEAMLQNFGVTEQTWREVCQTTPGFAISESPTYVARGIAKLAADPENSRYAGSILTARQLAEFYHVTDIDGSRPDCWGLIAKHGWNCEDGNVIQKFR
ncbi:SDR family oxidoreductase [Gorillibacterium timonense]|uniref:SDR family oxidoreductase n=1 Tax=Gorillibacterium timonense TaxID=1689269 RepID=UPI00071C3D78|nr:SDR family oxidoreductase [Gorillibacterium timonense]